MASKQQADQEFDPKYEWQDNAANNVLRVHLTGFRKEDFRVQVDGAGRLTVRGQRADGGKHVRLHKVFQLPPTSNLDDISGRFDAGVLSLTVPKRPAPPPATIDEIRKQQQPTKQADEAKAKEEKKAETKTLPPPPPKVDEASKKAEEKKAEINKKPKEEKKKAEQHKLEEAKKLKAEIKKPKEEDDRKKAADDKIKEALDAKMKNDERIKAEKLEASKRIKPEEKAVRKEEAKPKAEGPTETKPPQIADKAVDQDSLLERMRRRTEEDIAKAAEAAREEAERQKQQQSGGWKERMTEELHGLTTSEWAEGVVDTVKKNKEVIVAAVAAFSLGVFVSSRLFCRN